MAWPYSDGSSHGSYSSFASHQPFGRDSGSTSLVEDLRAFIASTIRSLWRFWNERGRRMTLAALVSAAHRLRRNLTYNRLLSFPHLLVGLWIVVVLWGERWIFHTKVEDCHWSKWENWPAGADPHHLIFVADPQLIDPHSYPGRPWPLNSLTMTITDNYLRRSYNQLQGQLEPDSIFFLGDLFDGGREWKTAHGDFRDPEWGPHPEDERKYQKKWNRKYGEAYWLREYARFGDIFFPPWVKAGEQSGAGQKRRKIVVSLPGNHDLGFGAEVKIPVRNRFEAYFGEGNRVDVVGNHTFVSVDTLSLSARSSDEAKRRDLRYIFKPTEIFLDDAQWAKKRAVEKELRILKGQDPELRFNHRIEDLKKANFDDRPELGEGAPDLPTILLTHVPLYRPKGTPCGPLREHSPPSKPPAGQDGPVVPDDRNAISISRGYQYQNVLSEEDSVLLVKKVGNVIHAFSGDDHDYCELTHDANQGNVPEITVKSLSMAMGVMTPGFLMVSLYNPIDVDGKPLAGPGKPTLQTHLCLLPSQLKTYARYATFGLLTVLLLTIRAVLVPLFKLPRFALDPEPTNTIILPIFKAKVEDYDAHGSHSAGFSASRFRQGSGTRDRSGSAPGARPNGISTLARTSSPKGGRKSHAHGHGHHHSSNNTKGGGSNGSGSGSGKWGWGTGGSRGPKIEIPGENEDFYNGDKWKAASRNSARSRSAVRVFVSELWTTLYRVVWMSVLFWGYLTWKG
ncbi:calcineurin-like phosphoesterase-domain-containing protein [Cercophora scortea]|uniref:Calcineurin-like phosphoesterase-domain-containing protein n=1 Tax=Cercophora scortea TaxID=314031 RepID=A0AAE0J1Y2_9PEZI|nr:calcineurin-like phosphoesterase-domain-containing protein [Cercophora scortea]